VTSAPALAAATPQAWYQTARERWPDLLIDHAACEKKAASSALSLLFTYAEDMPFARALSRLAREELRHYEQVLARLDEAGIPYRRLPPGRYALSLRRAVARLEPARRLDLLLVAALIEARSCERFGGLVPLLPCGLASFYATLAESESRHGALYMSFAQAHAAGTGLDCGARYDALAALEAELITCPDPEFRFHSGPPPTA
jgi:tRNA 2-(methylsulfanyl)-N6-isopentenyladenosine37 hydroxylase